MTSFSISLLSTTVCEKEAREKVSMGRKKKDEGRLFNISLWLLELLWLPCPGFSAVAAAAVAAAAVAVVVAVAAIAVAAAVEAVAAFVAVAVE